MRKRLKKGKDAFSSRGIHRTPYIGAIMAKLNPHFKVEILPCWDPYMLWRRMDL